MRLSACVQSSASRWLGALAMLAGASAGLAEPLEASTAAPTPTQQMDETDGGLALRLDGQGADLQTSRQRLVLVLRPLRLLPPAPAVETITPPAAALESLPPRPEMAMNGLPAWQPGLGMRLSGGDRIGIRRANGGTQLVWRRQF